MGTGGRFKSTYKKDRFGHYRETDHSIKRHLSERFGFKVSAIVLCEASFDTFIDFSQRHYIYCDQVDFQVCGIGYSTSNCFSELLRNRTWDA